MTNKLTHCQVRYNKASLCSSLSLSSAKRVVVRPVKLKNYRFNLIFFFHSEMLIHLLMMAYGKHGHYLAILLVVALLPHKKQAFRKESSLQEHSDFFILITAKAFFRNAMPFF